MHIFNCTFAESAMDDRELGNCIVKMGVDYDGTWLHYVANVDSLADCMDICRAKDIKYFVLVKPQTRCVCKGYVHNYENENECCDSGQATGADCESKTEFVHPVDHIVRISDLMLCNFVLMA